MEQKEMIRIRNLNKSYGNLHVLKDIDMKVLDSDVVCLIRTKRFRKKHTSPLLELFGEEGQRANPY